MRLLSGVNKLLHQIGEYLARLHYFIPSSHYALLAVFFFVGLEIMLALHRWIFVVIAIVLGITVLGIVLLRTEEEGVFHPTQAILPAYAAIGLTTFSLFVPTNILIHAYFAASAIVFFFLLKHGAKQAHPTWNWIISFVVLYALLVSILGWRFNLYTPVILILAVAFFAIFPMGLQSLLRYTKRLSETILIAGVMAFVLIEMIWALQFLPLHFFVQAGVISILYYVMFHLTAASYERTLKQKDFVEYISVGAIAMLLLLSTAKWV